MSSSGDTTKESEANEESGEEEHEVVSNSEMDQLNHLEVIEKAAIGKEEGTKSSKYLPLLSSYLSYLPGMDPKEENKKAAAEKRQGAQVIADGEAAHDSWVHDLLDRGQKAGKDARNETKKRSTLSSAQSEPHSEREEERQQPATTNNEELPGATHGITPEEAFAIPPPLPTTNLRRSTNVPNQSRAGAFHADGPGMDLAPAGTANNGIGGEHRMPSSSNNLQRNNPAMAEDVSGLARAHLVSDEEEQHRARAMEHDAQAIANRRKQFLKRWALVFLFFLGALVGGILVPVFALGTHKEKQPTLGDSFNAKNETNTTTAMISFVVSGLPNYTIAALEDKHSPQAQAYEWLLDDPNLEDLSEARKLQRFALATFYFATGGGRNKWNLDFRWLEYDEHECDWWNTATAPPLSSDPCYATEDGSQDPSMQAIALGLNGLVGTIPRQLGLLTGLRALVFHGNKLTGTIPKEVISLPRLEGLVIADNPFSDTPLEYIFEAAKENLWYLDLTFSNFTGTIPTNLNHLTNLEVLDLYGVKAEGSIPTEIGLLSRMNYLALQHNPSITGTIPTQIGRLTLLEHLSVGGNLRGAYPTQLGALTQLYSLCLGEGAYTGFLPSELGRLSHLEMICACQNHMWGGASGEFPSHLLKLTKLKCFNLANMGITGQLPPQLFNMTNLEQLILSGNHITGSITAGLGRLTALTSLNLDGVPFPGQTPVQLFNMTNLTSLVLTNNGISGPVPVELSQLTALTHLDLGHNQFSGLQLPLDDMISLRSLHLAGMAMAGQVPSQLFKMTQLTWLDLSDNYFTGSLPTKLDRLTNLDRLSVASNFLTGSLPIQLGQLTSLDRLSVANNFFTGTLPNEIFLKWNRMLYFWMNDNQLTGTLPTEICMMRLLFVFDATNNQLRGRLPSEIGQMALLYHFQISFNAFSGPVPVEIWKNQGIQFVVMNHNQLSGTIWQDIGSGWPQLRILMLASNQFQGLVPSSLGLLKQLTHLVLQDNLLSRTVPNSLGLLDTLKTLRLHGNLLSGTVPSSLGMLTKLAFLSLANQPLEGTLPEEVWQLPELVELSIGNCNVSGKIPSSGLSPKLSQLWIQDSLLTGVMPNELCSKDILFNCSASLCGCTCQC